MNSTTIPKSTIQNMFKLISDGKMTPEEANNIYEQMSETSSTSSGTQYNSTMSSLTNEDESDDDENCVYSERKKYNFVKNEKRITRDLNRFRCDFEELEEKETIYINQQLAAKKIYSTFLNRKNVITIGCGKTQSGKTGTLLAVIREFAFCTIDPVPIANIFIISGLSSKEWKSQTKARLPECLRSHVYARCDLKKLNLENKQNVLIIMDETQIAAKKNQSIDSIFNELGINGDNSTNFVFKNDIKIVQFSATPNGTILNAMNRTDIISSLVMIEPGPDYKSCTDYYDEGRVYETFPLAGDFYDPEKMEGLKTQVLSFPSPKYHIIRMPTKSIANYNEAEKNLTDTFPPDEFKFYKYDQENSNFEINQLLKREPQNHTFILFKEMGRCAKTYHKQYIGVWFERYVERPDDSVGIQGLLGRATGYDDNGEQIIYTYSSCIENFRQLWNSNFSENVEWNSNTTIVRKNRTVPRETYNAAAEDDAVVKPRRRNKEQDWVLQEFNSWEEMKTACKTRPELRKFFKTDRGPNRKHKENENGFIVKTFKTKDKIFTYDEIVNQKIWKEWLGKNTWFYYPCYHNPNDQTTLVWVFIYNNNA